MWHQGVHAHPYIHVHIYRSRVHQERVVSLICLVSCYCVAIRVCEVANLLKGVKLNSKQMSVYNYNEFNTVYII